MSITRKEMERIKGPWSPEEDEALQKLVQKHGPRNWSLISKSIPGRSDDGNFSNREGYDGNMDVDDAQPSKRSVSAGSGVPVSTGLHMSPGSPSGSDVSDSSLPGLSSSSFNHNIYRPVARTGGVLPPVETTSSSENNNDDPPTSLSLSLPGADPATKVPNRVVESTQQPKPNSVTPFLLAADPAQTTPGVAAQTGHAGCGFVGFSRELMTVMQEMIRREVRNYMMEQSGGAGGGMCYQGMSGEGFRNVAVNRVGVGKIE
ncbi:MYB PROTEIN-RELATED [Salix koriyanagi]|uniref:MYB PROTEIN-RELATED n=1 Tax=Salix koriyanagi TaxID=2511006 RepID=A0A9Q0P5G6_9ROSI|nr:MYB PROTEIN-RELATED [Salix koriyanagi]